MAGEILKALFYGILEGITEWLPVSSTGHLILLEEILPFAFTDDSILLSAFVELFRVLIQLGAVSAVVVLYRKRLFPLAKLFSNSEKRGAVHLWHLVALVSVPAFLLGSVGDRILEATTGKNLDGWLYGPLTVSAMLVLYGILFLQMERKSASKPRGIQSPTEIPPAKAFGIGLFQALSLVPGTSRSGATVLGGISLGIGRPAATDFSFFLAIPAMAGAGFVKLVGFFQTLCKAGVEVPLDAWLLLSVGLASAYLVSVVTLRFLSDYVKRHTFLPFGIYRILLGIFVFVWYLLRR